jgi:hypothetical protein
MVDIIRAIKNVLDVHGAWVFGGTLAAGLIAHKSRKQKSLDAEWDYVQCIGCGRGGYSDEMKSAQDASGKDHYTCARCSRPDLFKQAEGDTDSGKWFILNSYDYLWLEVIPHDAMEPNHGPVKLEREDFQELDDADLFDIDQVYFDRDWFQHYYGNDRIFDPISGDEFRIGAPGAYVQDYGPIVPMLIQVTDSDMIKHLVDGGCKAFDNPPQTKADWSRGDGVVEIDGVAYSISEDNYSAEEDSSNPCQHCDGAGGFPREFYYQPDRIEMIPCGTCLTQGRCPGCMEIYPSLSRDNTPEDVFFGSGCDRCGYSESDAREARKTARRWVELVDNPGAAKFMAEGGRRYKGMAMKPLDRPDRGENCDAEGCYQPIERRRKTYGWVIGLCEGCDMKVDGNRYEAEGDLPMDEDPYYSVKNVKCKSCGEMNTGSDTCSGPCGQCWACNCDCETLSAAEGDSDLKRCHVCGDLTKTETVELEVCERHTTSDFGYNYPDHEMDAEDGTDESDICSYCGSVDDVHSCWSCDVSKCIKCDDDEMRSDLDGHTYCDSCGPDSMDAEDYGVEAVWMADAYDPAIHGNTIPTGSVKRFLEKIPVGQMFHVDFVKSNGDIREMDAFFNKPYQPDSITANVMERTATGAVFKRFRVDRVVGLYRI